MVALLLWFSAVLGFLEAVEFALVGHYGSQVHAHRLDIRVRGNMPAVSGDPSTEQFGPVLHGG
jgi:hypothetical protein